jgi:hypothetical protein
MKSFKQYITELKNKNKPKDEEVDEGKHAADLLNAKAMYDSHNSNWHGDMGVASMISTPTPKNRMQGEKTFNSDLGLAFDVDESGELVGDPAGFKAVAQRKKENKGFSTVYPKFNLADYRKQLFSAITGQ